MKRILLASLLCVFLASCVAGGKRVAYSPADASLRGSLCKPEGPGPFPAIVYNHGGLGDIIGGAPDETCAALAKAGFVGFSPIRRLTRPLHGHMDDVNAGIDYVKRLAYVAPGRLGIMGFSRGGMLTYRAATQRTDLKAVVIMAAAVHRFLDLGLASSVSAPVLVLVAENDTGSRTTLGRNTLEGTKRLASALKEAGKDARLIIYPPYGGDGHQLFFAIGSYWPDVLAFFRRHL